MRAARELLGAAALVVGVAACGIPPTDVIERAAAPVIEVPPPSKTIYLLKDGELTMEPADVSSASVESLLRALFAASAQPLGKLDTALHGFVFDGIEDSLNPIQRDEVKLPRTSTLTVYVRGDGTLSKTAMAQIVCTAQQDTAIEGVKIVQKFGDRPPVTESGLTCGELR
ncbi:hypothetical protein [Nonomuraea harbinensis]|uniref:GerMN domain-containing protein n=1 Tax=Nonomuraea harbinensis TaxID=1286938 RepID=A0ABW1BXD6_9ACTN|nr:hypothetical protein [Nonomuraea harbinensis]